MRSLTVLDARFSQLLPPSPSSSSSSSSSSLPRLAATTLDPATQTTYAVVQQPPQEGADEVDLEVYRLAGTGKAVQPELLTLFSTPLHPLAGPPSPSFPAEENDCDSLVISLHYQPAEDALCLVLSNGEVEQVFLNGGVGEARRENVGTFDTGIAAAQWSPDDELLAIVTGDSLLLLLSPPSFTPLSESPLHCPGFGSDAPVSVGWGQKATQFHGSLGKTAAAAAAKHNPMDVDWILSRRDDGRVRVEWRGDSMWFAVSSVEGAPGRTDKGEDGEAGRERRVRRIRIFARTGEHSSTSEPLPGLEGALAWQPSGEVIASSQRLINEKGEEEVRVVFFERNGLRRKEFTVRGAEAGEGRAEACRMREVRWNAGSDVLAVWVERGEEDVVQLYHRSNYHWYLKQELSARLSPSTSSSSSSAPFTARLVGHGFEWHPENALELSLLTRDGIESYDLTWETFGSHRAPPYDDGTVAVVDGSSTLLTPFRLLNIPPPLAALTLASPSSFTSSPAPPTHIAFLSSPPPSSSSPSSPPPVFFVLLSPDSKLVLYEWRLPMPKSAKQAQEEAQRGLEEPREVWAVQLDNEGGKVARQIALVAGEDGEVTAAVLRSTTEGDEALLVRGGEGGGDGKGEVRRVSVGPEGARRIVAAEAVGEERDEKGFVVVSGEGEVFEVPASAQNDDFALPSSLSSLPEFTPTIQHVSLPPSPSSPLTSPLPTLIGLSPSGRLYSSSASGTQQLASDATSFVLTPDCLIYTTFSHEAKFLPLSSLSSSSSLPSAIHSESFARRAADSQQPNGGGVNAGKTVSRAVERGSRIVTAVPTSTSLVLQMPRGNLETVCPRPLVLRVVGGLLESLKFRSAFLLSRRHRIDLNLLHDYSSSSFRTHLKEFVDQVKEVEYLNLFLSGVKEEDVTGSMYAGLIGRKEGEESPSASSSVASSKVNLVLDLVRAELEKRDVFHYANSILTAHVRKNPPDYEGALKVLVELKAKDPERAEDAVKYIIFLSDANKLFDLALGMYDFPLVLMIAQHSQKDPREYLPFLRQLRALPSFLQRHKIDAHLGRHESALRNLSKAGEEHFDEALEYAKKHGLWEVALECYVGVEGRYEIVLAANAEYLFDTSKYSEAALLFQLAGQPEKALLAYQRANAWQELFTLALSTGVEKEEVKEMAIDVADNLTGKRRYAEAARVLLEYAEDVEAAVEALCEGNLYAEAVRITTLHSRTDLLESHIHPSTLDMHQRLLDDMDDLREQLSKQVSRLAELKIKREQNPYNYFCIDDPAAMLENVELAPDGMSDAGTAFTRYTVAPTTMASSTKQSSRTATSRRRQALKRAAGKKGSVYEEMYLLNSVKKTVEVKLAELQTGTSTLLPILLALRSSDHRLAASDLQSSLLSFESFLLSTLSQIWDPLERSWRAEQEEERRVRESGDVLRLAEWEARARPVEGEEETKRVERPSTKGMGKWRLGVVSAVGKE